MPSTTTAPPRTRSARWKDAPYLAALRYANECRMRTGMAPVPDLLPGTPTEPGRCTLANTIGRKVLRTPDRLVNEFIRRYDARRYPHLIERT